MSTKNEQPIAAAEAQEVELKEALTIVELEERFEMTAVAADSSRCIYNESA